MLARDIAPKIRANARRIVEQQRERGHALALAGRGQANPPSLPSTARSSEATIARAPARSTSALVLRTTGRPPCAAPGEGASSIQSSPRPQIP
ncbi:MAG: hypothetical protein ACKOUS_03730, partial [Alphaproteobacteria bacterium]